MHMLVSWFLNDEIEFKGDCLEVLQKHRDEFIDWRCARTARGRDRWRAHGGAPLLERAGSAAALARSRHK